MTLGAGGIHVNYQGVDDSTAMIGSVLSAFEGSNAHLDSLLKPLYEAFSGDAAAAGKPKLVTLQKNLEEFRGALGQVRGAIANTAGSAGLVKDTDKAQAARFLNL